MERLIFVEPTKQMETQIMEYRQEFLDNKEYGINGTSNLESYKNFDEWLKNVELCKTKETSKYGVATSTLFSVRQSDGKLIGSVQLRQELTEQLYNLGGQIGCAVRPSERHKGYAKQQMWVAYALARDHGLEEVLVICNKKNIGSIKTLLSAGAVLKEEFEVGPSTMHRYIVNLQEAIGINLNTVNANFKSDEICAVVSGGVNE